MKFHILDLLLAAVTISFSPVNAAPEKATPTNSAIPAASVIPPPSVPSPPLAAQPEQTPEQPSSRMAPILSERRLQDPRRGMGRLTYQGGTTLP